MAKVKKPPKPSKTAKAPAAVKPRNGRAGNGPGHEPDDDDGDGLKSAAAAVHDEEAEEAARKGGSDAPLPDFGALKEMFDEAAKDEEKSNARPALQWIEVECPHCGEAFEMCVDPGEEGQDMVQDCQVCCRPIELSVEVEEGELNVSTYRD